MENQTFSFKKIFIFLIVFIIVAVGVTFALITIKNNSNNSNIITPKDDDVIVPTTRKEVDYTYGLTTLAEKYTTNNIEIEELSYTEGKGFYQYPYSTKYTYPLEIQYFKIHGLKDKTVEEKINTLIKDTAFNLLPTQEADIKSVSYSIGANFSNVLSVKFSSSPKNKDTYDTIFNINLKDGSLIDIKDVFVDNLDITSLISKCAYDTISANYYTNWYNDALSAWLSGESSSLSIPVDGEKIESDTRDFMLDVNANNYQYYITNYGATIYTSKGYADIEFEDYYRDFAFCKRFLTTESLYTNEYSTAKEIYLGFRRSDDIIEPLDNLFIYTIFSYLKDNPLASKFEETINKFFEDEELSAKNKKDVMTLLVVEYSGGSSYSLYRCELPKDFYYNVMKDEFLKTLRNKDFYEEYHGMLENFFEPYQKQNENISISISTIDF